MKGLDLVVGGWGVFVKGRDIREWCDRCLKNVVFIWFYKFGML